MYNVAGRKFGVTDRFYKAFREPHKYIRKYRGADGKMRYIYPKREKPKSLWSRFFGSKPKDNRAATPPKPQAVKQPEAKV